MSYAYFCERENIPTEKDIDTILGEYKDKWENLTMYLLNEKKLKSRYKFYGKNYGWALGFSKSSKSIISLYPNENDFYIQIILNIKQEEAVLAVTNNSELKEIITNTEQIHEGKWIFVKVSMFNNVEEIKHITEIKCRKEFD